MTFTIGRVNSFTPDVLPGTVPDGGLKFTVGKTFVNDGTEEDVTFTIPESSDKKNCPVMVVDEMVCKGVIQLTLALLDWTPAFDATTASVPAFVPV